MYIYIYLHVYIYQCITAWLLASPESGTLIAIKGRPVPKAQENLIGFIQDLVLRRHAYTTNPIHQKCCHRSVVPSHCEPISQTQNNKDQPLVKLPCLVDY